MHTATRLTTARSVSFAAAALLSTFLVASLPGGVHAAPNSPYYHAVLAQGQAPDSVISSDVMWHGRGNELTASDAGLRAPMVCAELAQNVGQVVSFSAEGVALPQDKLDVCNKRARTAK